jgi:hypothetical protein
MSHPIQSGGAVHNGPCPPITSDTGHRRANGALSVHFGDIANHTFYIGLPSLQSHDGKDGIDAVVLFAVDRFYIKAVDFKNAEDVTVLDHSLGNAIPVVPHVVGLLIEWKPVESTEVHIHGVDVVL